MLGYKPWYYLVRLHDLVNSCLLYIWKNIRGSSNPLRGGSRAAATSKMECFVKAVNYYHKALHLGCCSSPRSASAYKVIFSKIRDPHVFIRSGIKVTKGFSVISNLTVTTRIAINYSRADFFSQVRL